MSARETRTALDRSAIGSALAEEKLAELVGRLLILSAEAKSVARALAELAEKKDGSNVRRKPTTSR